MLKESGTGSPPGVAFGDPGAYPHAAEGSHKETSIWAPCFTHGRTCIDLKHVLYLATWGPHSAGKSTVMRKACRGSVFNAALRDQDGLREMLGQRRLNGICQSAAALTI